MLLRGQEQVSAKRAMPVNEANLSSTFATSSSATVQLYYYSSGVRTSDAGQAAGTVVDAVFAHKNILNSLGTNVATKNDTSLSYTCLALTTELEISARPDLMALIEALDNQTPSTRAAQVGALLNNGEFIIDYRRGLLIGKKATTASTMTSVTYNYSTGGFVSVTAVVPGTGATNLGKAEDAAHASGDVGVMTLCVRKDTPVALAGSDGDYQPQISDVNGLTWVNIGTLFAGENLTNKALGTFSKFYNSTNQKPISVTYTSFTTQAIASSVPLTLVGARVLNTTASARYLFMNNASSIAGGAAPSVAPALIPASGERELKPSALGANGEVFSTALTIGNSSTASTFTAGSAGDLIITLYYVTATS